MRYNESPSKRPRMVVEHHYPQHPSPKTIVSSIHQAVTASQRFEILNHLFQIIKYDPWNRSCQSDPQIFMSLIERGVVNALCVQLGFVLHRHGSPREEIESICTAMDIFYRFSPDLVSEQSLRVNGRELFRLLPEAIRRGARLPVISIWHSCSSSGVGTDLLLEQSSFLRSIGELFRQGISDPDESLEILGLLKNITYHGEDFRQRLIEQPGILSSLTSFTETELHEKGQERLSAVIRNLAMSFHTRVVLAQRADVLTCIVRLSTNATQQTLRNLLNTLVSLAMDGDSCLLLVFHGDGMLIELLKRFLLHEDDYIVRKRAARTLRLLARESSVSLMINDNKLMDILSSRALHDSSNEVRAEAAEAFARCAGLIKAAMAQHDAVLEALSHLASSPHVQADVMARAVKQQACHPENRVPLAKHGKLLMALCKIAVCPKASAVAKENVCNTFLDLSADERSREAIATQTTLDALVHNAEDRIERHASVREAAVKTLLNLAVHPENRKSMAKQSRLIQSLLHFAANTTEDELKKKTKLVLLKLAAEL